MTLNSSRSISPEPSVSKRLNTSSGGIFDQSTPSSSSSSSSCCAAWRRVPVVSVFTVWSSAAPGAPPTNLWLRHQEPSSSSSSGLTRRRRRPIRLMVCGTVGPKQPLLRATGERPTAERLPWPGVQLLGAYKAVKGCPPAALRLISSMFMRANNHQPTASPAGAIGVHTGLPNF